MRGRRLSRAPAKQVQYTPAARWEPIVNEAPLKVISSMATRDLLAELVSRYSRETGGHVEAEAAGGVDVAKRVRAGEAFDVAVLASDVIDALIAEGRILPGRIDVAISPIAAAVRTNAPRPDIGSEAAVRRAVAEASSLSFSTGPSGRHLEKTFERWGILEAIRPRIVVPPPGVPVASLLADGIVELGFQQLSELIDRPGVEVLGLLPAQIQSLTIFSGGVGAQSTQPEAARALLGFLAAPGAADTKARCGVQPAS
jgi:molybdate transport system substrate-binding protein